MTDVVIDVALID